VIAFLRLAILSNMEIGQVPNVIVVDGDIAPGGKEGNGTTPSLLATAAALHRQVVEGCRERSRPLFKHFTPYIGETAKTQTIQANTPFGDYLIGQPVASAKPDDKLILDALFTRSRQGADQKSEQEILISRGFYARPSIGATAIYDLLNSTAKLKQLLSSLLGSAPGTIAVVGSSTGGTGSGGGPAITQWLLAEKRQKKSSANIALFMNLPWFVSTPSADAGEKEPSYGDETTQRLNAAASVRLYAESGTLPKAGVFLADLNGLQHQRNDDGNYGQPEYPHVFNLMLASQIENFFVAAERGDGTDIGVVGTYSFFHATDPSATDFRLNAADSPLIAFSPSPTQRQDIEAWAKETQSIRLILERLATFIGNDYRVDKQAGVQARKPRFAELMLELALELARSMGVDEGEYTELVGGIVGWRKQKRENAKVRKALEQSLVNRSKSLSATIAWLNELWRNSVSPDSNRPILEISTPAIQVDLRLDSGVHRNFPIFRSGDQPTKTVLDVFDDAFDDGKTENCAHKASSVIGVFKQLVSPDGGGMFAV
jgi:hypothetical protein